MFPCTRYETKMIMEGKVVGFARKYPGGCPHSPGSEIILTSKYLDRSGRNIPFAKVEVQTVRPGTVGSFRRDSIIAEMDGYGSGEHWFGQMRQMYGGLKSDEEMYHMKFRVKEIDKKAGQRGDVDK